MFSDCNVDETLDRFATEYYGIAQFSDSCDRLAVMRNYISALEAKVHSLKYHDREQTAALMAMF